MTDRVRLIMRIAVRNIRRQARRSVLTASAMVLGIGLLLFVRALQGGMYVSYVESAVRMGAGHVSLEHPDYTGSRDLADRIPASALTAAEEAIAAIAGQDEVRAVLQRVDVAGLAQSASSSIPVRISGVDPSREAPVSFFSGKVVEGRFLEPGDRLEALVGSGVAERLRIQLGSRLVLMAEGAGGDLESQLALVAGIFRTGIPEVDRGVVQIPLDTARGWLAIGDDATSLNVILDSDRRTGEIARDLQERLRAAGLEGGQVMVRPWWQAMPDLYAGIAADSVSTYVMLLILLVIVALAIVNSVLMAVLNRTREFGVVRALGLDRASVGGMVMVEGTLLTIASGIAGMALGLVVSFGIFRDGVDLSTLFPEDGLAFAGTTVDPVVLPVLLAADVIVILAIVMAIGILASIYPAWRATRIEPAEAMKTED